MRIWDVSPGYLNRQSLLGEHRELHGLHSILVNHKSGYSRHPETVRWVWCVSGLARRHAYLVEEMRLRGYSDRTPIVTRAGRIRWPKVFVTPPSIQFSLLGSKYIDRQPGRIPLPRSPQELWAHHKYSVLARDRTIYADIGRRVARMRRGADVSPMAEELVLILRDAPPSGSLVDAVEHMWGHVSKTASAEVRRAAHASAATLLQKTRELALQVNESYLMTSTALSELALFCRA